MASTVSPTVIKKTQNTLGKYVKKPPLTEKLLKKPPFRFLHDVISAVIRDTGVLKGLYDEVESVSDNVKDKDGKMKYLDKAIACVSFASGETISAKPSKIVSGQEPEKTNEFLQVLGRLIEKKVDTSEAVAKVLNGEKPGKSGVANGASHKAKAGGKENNVPGSKPASRVSTTRSTASRDRSNSISKDKTRSRSNSRESTANSRTKSSKSTERNITSAGGGSGLDSLPETSPAGGPDSGLGTLDEEPPTVGTPNGSGVGHDGDATVSLEHDHGEIDTLTTRSDSARQEEITELPSPGANQGRPMTSNRSRSNVQGEHGDENEDQDDSAVNVDVVEQNGKENTVDAGMVGVGDDDNESDVKDVQQFEGDQSLTSTKPPEEPETPQSKPASGPQPRPDSAMRSARPRTGRGRPPSARPAAPRLKEKAEIQAEEELQTRPMTGKVANVIIAGDDKDNDDDGDEFLIEEKPKDNLDLQLESTQPPKENVQIEGDAAEHGGLVQKILETQKELEDVSKKKKTEIEIERDSGLTDVGRRRDRESTQREVDKLRSSIQTLTRSANPLGKLMDFLQEDVDAMQRELETWKDENRRLKQELKKEESLTSQSVEPLKVNLTELEAAIQEQLDKISTVKSNILKNDEKIDRMISSIGKAAR